MSVASVGGGSIPPPPLPSPSLYAFQNAASGIVYDPKSDNNAYYYCYYTNTGQPIEGCDVSVATGYYSYTNAHQHESSSHPSSSVSPSSGYTDANGNFYFTISTTLLGQIEAVFGYSSFGNAGYDYAVGYSDLVFGDIPSLWTRIGAPAGGGNHGTTDDNRFMTADTYDGLYYATNRYLQTHPGQTNICVNDAALPIGGKFDLGLTWISGAHHEHDRGSAVDIATTTGQCAASETVNGRAFAAACTAEGAVTTIVHVPPEAPHVHCNWRSIASYAHN